MMTARSAEEPVTDFGHLVDDRLGEAERRAGDLALQPRRRAPRPGRVLFLPRGPRVVGLQRHEELVAVGAVRVGAGVVAPGLRGRPAAPPAMPAMIARISAGDLGRLLERDARRAGSRAPRSRPRRVAAGTRCPASRPARSAATTTQRRRRPPRRRRRSAHSQRRRRSARSASAAAGSRQPSAPLRNRYVASTGISVSAQQHASPAARSRP